MVGFHLVLQFHAGTGLLGPISYTRHPNEPTFSNIVHFRGLPGKKNHFSDF